ncbi:MAG: hypothetical protein M1833_002948 [Piccolia ochrophora]|nr:MAG: hypothetical protein M1833_002948 [Piccolia ochrophora]
MISPRRRHRSSTTASASSASAALTGELHGLIRELPSVSSTEGSADGLDEVAQLLHRIRQHLIDSDQKTQAQDAFRCLHGFQALLDALRSLKGRHDAAKQSHQATVAFFEVLRTLLGVLAEALRDHAGNRRYFSRRIEKGGWIALEQALSDIEITRNAQEAGPLHEEDAAHLLGCLFGFALGDETLTPIFGHVKRHLASKNMLNTATSEDIGQAHEQSAQSPSRFDIQSAVVQAIREKVHATIGKNEMLCNPEIVRTIFRFWLSLPRTNVDEDSAACLPTIVILALHRVAQLSRHNLLGLHRTGLLSMMLPVMFDGVWSVSQTSLLHGLAATLMTLGVSSIQDAQYLLRRASQSEAAAHFLISSLKISRTPAQIQFDLSFCGFSSVEMSTLGRSFPPTSSSSGYSVATWLRVDRFDEISHTTVFGAFDASQTCFVLAYIEKDTKNFILQTSITSSRPSIRFKSRAFTENRWYHIVIVHRRPRATSSSRATLFVDGESVEQVKCQYPATPPTINSGAERFGAASSAPKQSPVQVFLGTPQDLSPRLGKDVVTSRWSLASFHLFEGILSDDLIAIYYHLGPRYNGNYQDCLGSFQTYDASAALNMRNETLHLGKEEKSELVTAIRHKASILLPESRILFHISPTAVLDDDDRNNIDESQLIRSLSKQAGANLQRLTRSGSNAVAINCAIPSINEALIQPHGVALLTGDPIVSVPFSLDDALWRVGGCVAIGLKLIELAKTREAIVQGVEILLESVKASWRNSEAMERENAFGVLSTLLSNKLRTVSVGRQTGDIAPIEGGAEEMSRLSFQLLSLVLGFVGYQVQNPDQSMLINPLAYRVLLVDFDLWRSTAPVTQRLYYRQFIVFGSDSKYRDFNTKRLNRMRIVRKLLDALKSDSISQEALPDFMLSFKCLVKGNLSAEVLRSLALFVTYALHKPRAALSSHWDAGSNNFHLKRRPTGSPVSKPIARTSGSPDSHQVGLLRGLSRLELGIRVLEMYTELLCDDPDAVVIRKFAKTVTNKWLLYLLAEDEARVVVLGAKILARLLTVHGGAYVTKFADKNGGFVIIKERLRRWWSLQSLWPILFAILFDFDLYKFDFNRPFDLYSLLDSFLDNGKVRVVYPEILPAIACMLGSGLRSLTQITETSPSPLKDRGGAERKPRPSALPRPQHSRRRSMSLNADRSSSPSQADRDEHAATLQTVSQFLVDIHAKSQNFKDFAVSSQYVQELLFVLFPIIVSYDSVSAETELNSRDSGLTFDGGDVIIRSLSQTGTQAPPIVRTTSVEAPPSPQAPRARPLRRGSSFVLITSDQAKHSPSTARLNPILSPRRTSASGIKVSNSSVEGLLEIIVAVFVDQVLERKDFPGFGLFFKVPPGFQEHQAYFESYILRHTMSQLDNTVKLNQKLLWEPRVLTNLSRYFAHMSEAIFEGWFLNGTDALLGFAGTVLEYLERPDIAQIKSVRLCNQTVLMIRTTFMRVLLLRLSELDGDTSHESDAVSFLDKLMYWQTIILSAESHETETFRLLCYHLYIKLVDSHATVRVAAANLWRIFLVQKPGETSNILNQAMSVGQQRLSSGFKKLVELDNDTFIDWVDDHREDLDAFFFGAIAKYWEDFVVLENQKTQETARHRVSRRKEKLKQWVMEDMSHEDTLRRHEVASHHWMVNIYASEHLKHQRALQDQQDNLNINIDTFNRLNREVQSPCGLWSETKSQTWRLDQTEGRNRMRLRILPDIPAAGQDYQPKRSRTRSNATKLNLDTRNDPLSNGNAIGLTPTVSQSSLSQREGLENGTSQGSLDVVEGEMAPGDEFEMVDDPRDDIDSHEDKNRKVMRSLERGDQVQNVYNVSRIVGLEACEGLLIIGKECLYLMDNFFQRSDGEIVNVWQAPMDERDPYLQMISGRESGNRTSQKPNIGSETRHWKWQDVISISKRRFLFRDVAVEVFFTDGRSYLLTTISPALRNDVHQRLMTRAPHTSGNSISPHPEDSWRLDTLRSPEDIQQTFGSKFASVFSPAAQTPATRKWAKGEISNFHYLMLVNTLAGRTFNDLTQYPVFPWVLADYTSAELDLTNPRSFRDLSKPMGCQTAERQAEFRGRYQSFAEMGDQNAPPFHYGTHYSSAMIVTSYLIRLQPFVQSYLLLQGGNFDHADRMFYSIEKAWASASRDNMTDVRELTPEFYYLPEFLKNVNGYNFGTRQGTEERIDDVALPPWANGDPQVFVTKHREALESPHVSKQLHHWIDLVFGCKQRGEAAMEATNVFHHLSYSGAKDLDNIEDPVERLATIGIIHNFGQTPHQVFPRSHPQREEVQHKFKRLDTAAESLTRLPFPLLESGERVASLLYSAKHDRLLCSAAFRLNIPPTYDKYMEWGFSDNSVRFYSSDGRKLVGIFEHLHQGQLSSALFADSKTLITAGTDCVVSVWYCLSQSPKTVDLQLRSSLFGHRTPVIITAVSKSFSAFLSAAADGQVFLWDLNRLDFVRELASGAAVQCASINDVTGTVMLCRGQKVVLYTLNGQLLLDQSVCKSAEERITSCAFYEGVGNEWLERDILFTGHRHGVVNVWAKAVVDGIFSLELVKRLNPIDQALGGGPKGAAAITFILPMAQVVYAGDEDGRVYEWDCVQRQD